MKPKVTKRTADPLDPARTLCPVARAELVVGDRWTVLVLRELFSGNHRFEEIQAMTGATPQMAAARLKQLEADGLVERRPYSEHPPRYGYHLTPKGDAFFPVILALRQWGEAWVKSPKEGLSVTYTHATCGKPAGMGTVCESCGKPLRRKDLIVSMNPAYKKERDARLATFKANR